MKLNRIEIEAFDFIDELNNSDDIDFLLNLFSKKIENYGFTDFLITHMPPSHLDFAPHIILNGWSEEWFDRYMEKDFYSHDPMAQHTRNSIKPFFWDQVHWKKNASSKTTQVMNEAKVFGLNNGFSVPMHATKGDLSCITMGGEALTFAPRTSHAIHLMSLYLYQKITELKPDNFFNKEPLLNSSLTIREKECLKWIAQGKTDWEVSTILSISEHTASAHIRNAMKKLNAVTRTQAVASAMSKGEILL